MTQPDPTPPPHPQLPPSSERVAGAGRAALAAILVAALGGCGFVKINGKTLGAPSSSESAASSSSGDASSAPSQVTTTTSSASAASTSSSGVPEKICRFANTDSSVTIDALERELNRKDVEYAAEALVGALCTTEGELVRERPRFLQMAKKWMDARHLDQRDVIALFQMAHGRADTLQPYFTVPEPVRAYGFLREGEDRATLLDEAPKGGPTALWTVARLYACFKLKSGPFRAEQHSLATTMVCSRKHFEVAKADAEIDSTPQLNDTTRYKLRAEVARAAEALRLAQRSLVDRAAKDPHAKALLTQAEVEYAQWRKPSPRRAAATALFERMQEARISGKPGAFEGCEEETVRAWSEAVRGIPLPDVGEHPSEREYGDAMLISTETYLTFMALRYCAAASETTETAPQELRVPSRSGDDESVLRLLQDGAQDERDERDHFSASGSLRRGVISRIRDVPGGVEVTFEKIMRKQRQCQRYRRTNRVTRIDSSGNLVYEEVCTSSANVSIDASDEPVRFGKTMAQGLRPGMYLVALEGLPVVATSSAKSKKPIFALGAMLR